MLRFLELSDYIELLVLFLPDGYAMLMKPNKAETAVHGCHCPGDMAVRMRKVLARLWVGVRVCHLFLLFFIGGHSEFIYHPWVDKFQDVDMENIDILVGY